MNRQKLPWMIIGIGLACGSIIAWETRLLEANVIVVSGQACTCADFRVILGSWKIQSPLLDTIQNLSRTEVYVRGKEFPSFPHATALYDHHALNGTVIGVDRVSEGDEWHPVINVDEWSYLGFWWPLFYGTLKWITVVCFLLGFCLLVAK